MRYDDSSSIRKDSRLEYFPGMRYTRVKTADRYGIDTDQSVLDIKEQYYEVLPVYTP